PPRNVTRDEFCSPIIRHTHCHASTNRRSGQATYPAVCSKRATLLGNVHRANGKPLRAELTKRLDVKRPLKYRSRIFWVDGAVTKMESRVDRYRRMGADDELRATRARTLHSVTPDSRG